MTACVRGIIKTQSGDPVSGTAVKLIHEPTGSAFAKTSDFTGAYQFESVRVGGPYLLSVNCEGKGVFKRDSFNLKIDETFVHDFLIE